MADKNFCVALPKVELHAHLNGSIRDSTLLELARDLDAEGIIVFSDIKHVILKNDRSLPEVFKLFALIRILTTDHDTITRITKEVIEDFASENVVYLELRTTPKRDGSKGMSKQSYLEAVLEGLRSVCSVDVDFPDKQNAATPANNLEMNDLVNGLQKKKIYVRFLLCVDRHESTEDAMETVKLALEMRHRGVVGIDLSGNPTVGKWETWLPAFEFAREQGLPITLHCNEVPNLEEINAMLDFHPERIGHACCYGDAELQKLKESNIPVEICLTSNIRTETISSIDVHHFADLYHSHHPLALCTDDAGVFSTSLSAEYNLASSVFGLSRRQMFELSRGAIDFAFTDDGVKMELREMFTSAERELLL